MSRQAIEEDASGDSEYCEHFVATFNRDASWLTLCPDWHLHQEPDLIQWEVLCQKVFYSRSWGCQTITLSGVLTITMLQHTQIIFAHMNEEGVSIDQQFKHTSPQKLWERMMMVKDNLGGSSSCLHTILSIQLSTETVWQPGYSGGVGPWWCDGRGCWGLCHTTHCSVHTVRSV